MSPKVLFITLIIGSFILALYAGLFMQTEQKDTNSKSLQTYANEIISKCSTEDFAPACYDEEVPGLMLSNNISMEDAFEVVRLIQQQDERYLYCHVVGHKLSEIETSKDLNSWKDVLARCPTTFCNNGCLHGALMQRFGEEPLTDKQIEQIKPDLKEVCEPREDWNPVGVEVSMCYHGIGHLNMYITDADIKKSVELCNIIGTKSDDRNYVETCTYGVFMQIYQPLEPEDFALVEGLTPKKDKIDSFCEQYRDLNIYSWHGCKTESWPLFAEEIREPEGLVEFCSYTDKPAWQKRCYAAKMNIINTYTGIYKGDMNGIKEYCRKMPNSPKIPESPRELCFAFSAQQLIQLDPVYVDAALEMCAAASEFDIEESCYDELAHFGHASFHPGSERHTEYCRKFPSEWFENCITIETPRY